MDPAATHQFVENYNWDKGLDPIGPIVESPHTEFATALLVYWRLGGPWLAETSTGVNQTAYRMQCRVRERFLAGYYPQGSCSYDPSSDLSKVQIFKLRKSGIPELLLGDQTSA